MLLSVTEILEKIHLGEDSTVEFKVNLTSKDRNNFATEIAAFANARGGVILIGVSDAGTIVGVDPNYINQCEKIVTEVCQDSIEPAVVVFTEILNIGNRILLKVEVPQGLFVHKSPYGYYIRHGSSKREMKTEYLARLLQNRSQVGFTSFDGRTVPNTQMSSLNRKLYIPAYIRDSDDELTVEQALLKRHLLVKSAEGMCASVSGILMCCDQPDDYIPNSYITAVYYSGLTKDSNYQIDAKDIKGPLDQQILGAYKFVESHNRVRAIKDVGRQDLSQYSMRAVFEGIVNAVVHRDYSKHGSRIRIFMYADRIEIYSPGALLNTITVEELPYVQVTRNELLSRLLSEVSLDDELNSRTGRKYFLERRGEGVGIILRESRNISGKDPVYKLHNEELCLTIFSATLH